MPADRTTTAVPAAARSAFPQLTGVSPGFAVLIAVAATLAGFALEAGAGHSELGSMFAVCYALGCLAAVLLVRQSGVFTAVIQPPLLLFVAVPTAYFLLHSAEFSGLKGFLITCGYPLIERFPLMFFTTMAVLVIGMVRWYSASAAPRETPAAAVQRPANPGFLHSLMARLTPQRPPRHGIDRSATGPRPGRGTRESQRTRQEYGGRRRPVREEVQPDSRRQRAARDPRVARASDQRVTRGTDQRSTRGADQPRRLPRDRREPYPPMPRRGGGYESYGARDRGYYPREDPREAYPADPRPSRPRPQAGRPQPPPGPRPVRDSTHHPVSRVRYRGGEPDYPDHPPRR